MSNTPLRSLVSCRPQPARFQDLVMHAVKAKGREDLVAEIARVGLSHAVANVAADAGIPNPEREAATFVAGFSMGSLPMW